MSAERYTREVLTAAALRCGVPEHDIDGLVEHVMTGRPTGSFLELFLSNDLMGAMGRADAENQRAFHALASWLYTYAPAGSYGAPGHVARWRAIGGIEGISAQVEASS